MAGEMPLARTNSPGAAKFLPAPPLFSRSSLPGSLKLHDYRRLQLAAEPLPVQSHGKLKRKAGISDLAAAQSEDSPLVSPSSGATEPVPFDWSPTEDEDDDDASITESDSSSAEPDYSFASTAKSFAIHTSRPKVIQTRPTNHIRRVSSDDADRFYRSSPHFRQRNQPLTTIYNVPAPLSPGKIPVRAATVSERGRDPSTASNTSQTANLLLSQFPKPPQTHELSTAADREGRKRNKAGSPPTVYHFRGASFEIVNPRASLCLQNIETPAENDGERAEYFHAPRSMASPPVEVETPAPPAPPQPPQKLLPQIQDQSDKTARSTPPRSLYDDLPSAYNSITSRTAKDGHTPSPLVNNPEFPPVPVPPPYLQHRVGVSPTKSSLPPDAKLETQAKPTRSSSLRRKLSNALRLKKHSAGSASEVHGKDIAPPLVKAAARVGHQRSASNPEGRGRQEPTAHFNPHSNTNSNPRLRGLHYYDELSVFNESLSRNDSGTMLSVEPHSSHATPAKAHYAERENDSNASLIDAYQHGFADSPSASKGLYRRHRELLQPTDADSTIGDIFEDYHRQDESCSVPPEFISGPVSREDSTLQLGTASIQKKPSLRRSTSGLSQFSFGFEKQPSAAAADEGDAYLTDYAARVTNMRDNQPGPAPRAALPDLPPNHVKTTQPMAPNQHHSGSSDEVPSLATAYSDTQNLLRSSSSPVEVGRTNSTSNLSVRQPAPATPFSATLPFANSANDASSRENNVLSLPSPRTPGRSSRPDLEQIIQRDLKHLSSTSGISNLSANIFVFNDDAQAQDQEDSAQEPKPPFEDDFQPSERDHLRLQNNGKENFVPLAAFSQHAVRPGITRLSNAERRAVSEKAPILRVNDDEHVFDDETGTEDADDELDWETIPDSRRTMASLGTQTGSLAECLSQDSLRTFRKVGVHPGNTSYQHSYRLRSPQSIEDPLLMPTYDFKAGADFPFRNALAEPKPSIYTTYNSPAPTPSPFTSPFTSSPPQIAGSSSEASRTGQDFHFTRETEDAHLSAIQRQRPNLSVVHEQSETFTFDERCKGDSNPSKRQPALTSEHSSDWLSSEPGPELSNEAEDGSPLKGKYTIGHRPKALLSGIDSKLLAAMRRNDHRMASSPLSDSNSFAQFSRLGPKANITGTPNGTNMREVGSSLVGSSSPFVPPSSPPVQQMSTPITPASPTHVLPRSSPLVPAWSSPLSQELFEYDEFHFGTGRWMNSRSNKPTESFRDAMIAASQGERHGRRSVVSQHKLMEIALAPRASCDISFKTFVRPEPRGRLQRRSDGPLLPVRAPSAHSPHLFPYRATSAEAKEIDDATRKVSWVVFALCTALPPLLITYGHGAFDRAIGSITRGKVIQLGCHQKHVAKWTGYIGSVAIVLALVVAFIVVRTVPNELPK